MRKRITKPGGAPEGKSEQWLDLPSLAQVELSSECRSSPIEGALAAAGSGWRAAGSGNQFIRVVFDRPHRLRRIHLEFFEKEIERTQEFSLRWSKDSRSYEEIVRQQWNFSPAGATRQVEDYRVDLSDVAALELHIVPDISGGSAVASLARLRLA